MEGSEFRRSMTLSEQLSIEHSPNHKLDPPTVAATGGAEKREAFADGSGGAENREAFADGRGPGRVSSRTLMDIIKEEHDSNGGVGSGINWKSLKDRLRRAGAAWATSSASISDPDVVPVRPNPAALGRSVTVRNAEMPFSGSASYRRAIVSEYNPAATAAEEESDSPASGGSRGSEEEEGEGSEGSDRSGMGGAEAVPVAEEQPVRMSLMTLLEQAEGWGGVWEAAAGEKEELADDDGEEGGGGRMDHVCCVCMVRHKGAAFIPCGHTFCRLCSRELWVSRGNCPLCNSFVLEILDIF